MWKFIILFLSISFGTVISLGESGNEWYNVQYVEIALCLFFASVFIFNFRSGRSDLRIDTSRFERLFFISLFICAVYSVATYFWSDYSLEIIPGTVSIFIGMLAFVIAKIWLKEDIKPYVVANRFLLLGIVLQLIPNFDFGAVGSFYELKGTSSTKMGNSNYLSVFLGFFFLYEFIAKDKHWIWFTLLSLLGLFITLSKGGILAVGLSLLVYLFITIFTRKSKKIRSILSLSIIVGIAYYFFTKTGVGQNFLFNMNFSLENNFTSGRTVLIDDAFKQIASQPFGNGIVLEGDPHNVVIRSWRDLGIFVGTLYAFLLIYPMFLLVKFRKYSTTTIALLVGYLSVVIHAMAEIFYFNGSSIIWTMFTLVAINQSIKNERKKKSKLLAWKKRHSRNKLQSSAI